jgi:hypothetical protein
MMNFFMIIEREIVDNINNKNIFNLSRMSGCTQWTPQSCRITVLIPLISSIKKLSVFIILFEAIYMKNIVVLNNNHTLEERIRIPL